MFGKRNPKFPIKSTTASRSPHRDQFALHRSASRPNAVPVDLFKPTHDIFNSKNREPNPTQYQSAKQLNYTDTSDHLRLSPRKKHSIPDHIEMDMMVSRSHSTPRFKPYREKVTDFQQTYPEFITRGRDTSMNNVGEFINDVTVTGVRRIDARNYSSCDTRKDLEKPEYRFFVEPASPQNLSATNSPTRISKAFKAIYELNNEGRSCLMADDSDQHENTRALFTSVIHDSVAAGGVGTIHKKFVVKNPTKRYYDHLKTYLMKRTASCASVSSEVSQQFEKADKTIESFLPLQNLKLRNTGAQKNNYVQEIIRKSQAPPQAAKEEGSPTTQKGAETTTASLILGSSPTGSESRYIPWSKTPTNQSKLFQIKSIPLSASKSFSECPQSPTVHSHTARSEHATQPSVTPKGRRTEATTPSVVNTSRIQQGATPTKGSQAQAKSWGKIEPKTPVSSGGTPSRAKANNNPVRGSNHTGLYGQGVKVTPNLKRGYFSCKK